MLGKIEKHKTSKKQTEKTIKYDLKFIDSFKFMETSMSHLTDGLSEDFHQKNLVLKQV